jgi:hypothetical protein
MLLHDRKEKAHPDILQPDPTLGTSFKHHTAHTLDGASRTRDIVNDQVTDINTFPILVPQATHAHPLFVLHDCRIVVKSRIIGSPTPMSWPDVGDRPMPL